MWNKFISVNNASELKPLASRSNSNDSTKIEAAFSSSSISMEQYDFVSRKVAADLITGFPIIELNLALMDSSNVQREF